MTQAEGHLEHGKPMPIREAVFDLSSRRFERIDGAWLPMETDWTTRRVYGDSRYSEEKRHIKVTKVTLNPRHDVLGSLVPDDLREGADVWVPPAVQIRHNWRGGKTVAQIDEDIVKAMDETLDKMLTRKDSGGDPNEAQTGAKTGHIRDLGQKRHWTHCGLYCLYSVLRLGGQKLDFRELVKPGYFGSQGGSTLAELRRGAVDYGLHAEVMSRLSTRALRGCPYTAVLHVKPHAEAREYNHYELFMGTEDSKAKMFNPPEAPRLVSFQELAGTWDGAALLLSAQPLNVDKVLTADRQRLLLCGIIGVLALLGLHVGRLIWTNLVGALSRWRTMKLTLAQCTLLGLVAFVFALVYHLANSEALLANTTATASVQKAYAGSFIPRISAGRTRRLLGADTVFIDARLASDYKAGHLDRAINLPIDANDALWKNRVASIPRGKRIVIYCQSDICRFAEAVSLRLMRDGFSGISIYRGGWNDWVARDGDAGKEKKDPAGPGPATQNGLTQRHKDHKEERAGMISDLRGFVAPCENKAFVLQGLVYGYRSEGRN
jgi:rhodanese-related sulfurtransferase